MHSQYVGGGFGELEGLLRRALARRAPRGDPLLEARAFDVEEVASAHVGRRLRANQRKH
mgnify:CR=1 FL=1